MHSNINQGSRGEKDLLKRANQLELQPGLNNARVAIRIMILLQPLALILRIWYTVATLYGSRHCEKISRSGCPRQS